MIGRESFFLSQFDDRGGLTRDQLALLSGYTRSGTFDTYVGTLTRLDFAVKEGDVALLGPDGPETTGATGAAVSST